MSYEAEFEAYMKEEHNVETDGFTIPEESNEDSVEEESSVEEELVEEVVEETTEEEVAEETEEDETEEESVKEEPEVERYTFKANGEQYEATLEELTQLASKGMDYTNKTKRLAKSRPIVELAEEHGISIEEFKMFVDAKSGNKEAFAMLANQSGVDPLDVDGQGNYQPRVEKVDYELKDVVDSIRDDAEYGTTVNGYVSKLPDKVQSYMADNPQVLQGIHVDTQNGISQKIMPEVIKRLAINPNQEFVSLYREVGQSIFSNEQQESKPERTRPPEGAKKAVIRSKKSSQPKSVKKTLDAFSSDEDFAKLDEMIRTGTYNR